MSMIKTYRLVKVPEKYHSVLWKLKNHPYSVFAALMQTAWGIQNKKMVPGIYWKRRAQKSICIIYFDDNHIPVGISLSWGRKIGCYVVPRSREQGIGTKLIKRMIKKMKGKPIVVPFNSRGVHFYDAITDELKVRAVE